MVSPINSHANLTVFDLPSFFPGHLFPEVNQPAAKGQNEMNVLLVGFLAHLHAK